MKIYRITCPNPSSRAFFVAHNEFAVEAECAVCEGRRFERIFPAEIEYLGGPVGDFQQASNILISPREVALDLARNFEGIELREVRVYSGVSFWSDPKRRKPLMAKAYSGPDLVEIWMPLKIAYDPKLSKIVETGRCDACGILNYQVPGVERLPNDKRSSLYHNGLNYRRDPADGIRVRMAALNGASGFRYGGRLMVLAPVRDYILERGYTNADFIDYGETL